MSDDLSIPNPGYRGARAGRYGMGGQPLSPRGMDPDTRRMALFAGGVGVVLALLIGASALTGHRSGEIPVITADTRPIRVKPENPGGMKIDAAENDVFSGGSDRLNAKLAAPAETPDTKGWHAPAAPPPAPPHVAEQAPVAAPAVAPPKIAAEPPRPPAAPPAALPALAAASGHASVQLAALSTEQAARGEWQSLAKRMPDLFGHRQPSYSRTEKDGHSYWRVRTAGFTDAAQARGFCEKVRAKGATCSVADF